MFDIGWSEMLVVGVVALIVVGPKDLPKMFHTLGEMTGKARGMAREFQRAMDAAAKETGMDGVVKDFKRAASGQSIKQGLKEAAGFDDIEKEFRDIGHDKPAVRSPGTKAGPTMPPAPVAPDEEFDEIEADEIEAQDLARRNAELSATDEQRIKKQKQADAARQKAAAIRAKREAAEAAAPPPAAAEPEPQPWQPEKPAPRKRAPRKATATTAPEQPAPDQTPDAES
ncbi:MAG: twin-arginine translocase subunit TatB [Rhodobacteraceae bacterium]|nr:twin-arginine translocase subunit TatB [Paracoccaceae bacterium]